MTKSRGQLHADFLRGVRSGGGQIIRADFERGPSQNAPTFHVLLEQNGVRSLQELPWTPELEKYLLFEDPRKMDSQEEEAERFATILYHNLATVEQQFGDRYVGLAVFLEILRGRNEYDLKSLLDRIPEVPISVSDANPHVRDFVTRSIDGLQNTAIVGLGYSKGEALALMTAALRIVLEETFYIPR